MRRWPLTLLLLVAVPLLGIGCEFFEDLDDDSEYPDYEGDLDLDTLDAMITCDSGGGTTGTWDVVILFDGWADYMWMEMHSSGYSECFDSSTGDACVMDGVQRPGWYMDRYDHGWDEDAGFWDEWEILLDFDSATWPPSSDESYFGCEDSSIIDFYFCGCDEYTGECRCSGAEPA